METKELWATGRAIAFDERMAWVAALRADLRRAVRNMVRVVESWDGVWGMLRVKKLVMSEGSCFRAKLAASLRGHMTRYCQQSKHNSTI